jgi:hypothetical protein
MPPGDRVRPTAWGRRLVGVRQREWVLSRKAPLPLEAERLLLMAAGD